MVLYDVIAYVITWMMSACSPIMATKSASSTTPQQDGAAAVKKKELRKPVFVKVDSLKPGTNGHTLTVKVVTAETVLNKKPRNPTFRGAQNQNTKIAECLVGDDTGTILFTARNDQVELMSQKLKLNQLGRRRKKKRKHTEEADEDGDADASEKKKKKTKRKHAETEDGGANEASAKKDKKK